MQCNVDNTFVKVHILKNKRNMKTQHTQVHENRHKLMTKNINYLRECDPDNSQSVSQVSTEFIQYKRRIMSIGVRHSGRPCAMRWTSFARDSQNLQWPQGTGARRDSRGWMRHTSHSCAWSSASRCPKNV